MLRFLAKQDFVDFNIADNVGETPISSAIKNSDLEIVKFLVEKGADIEHREIQGRTPLYYASSRGCLEITEYLISLGADVNARTAMGRTGLLKGVWNGNIGIVKACL